MVSFEVASLFTIIPLKESINLAVSYITEGNTNLNFSKAELTRLFSIKKWLVFLTFGNYYLYWVWVFGH